MPLRLLNVVACGFKRRTSNYFIFLRFLLYFVVHSGHSTEKWKMDYQGIPDDILDEIALEGLDGITISCNKLAQILLYTNDNNLYKLMMACLYFIALWSRLGNRKGFSIALDNNSKKYIWGLLCKNESIQMFLLQEPRPPLDNYNRYDYVDPEFEVICEPVSHIVLTIL